ncbi:MAG: hypothetical protein ACK4JB_17355 [Reyranella sp.]
MLEDLRQWALPLLGAISLIWQVVGALRKNAVRKEDLAKFATVDDLASAADVLKDQVGEVERETIRSHHRADLLEQQVKNLPDYEDITKLQHSMAQLDNKMATIAAEVKGIDQNLGRTGDAVDRIEQHLLREKKAA